METEVTLRENNVALTVFVNNDFTATGINFGYIEVHDGCLETKSVFWDNIGYFFDLDKDKSKDLKKELKENEQYYTGVVKDIKKVIKKAIKVEILIK